MAVVSPKSALLRQWKNWSLDREKLVIQSKCGIRKGFLLIFKEHILDSVDGILSRLQIDYLDLWPSTGQMLWWKLRGGGSLRTLRESGKCVTFWVLVTKPLPDGTLQSYLDEPLVVNQLQLSPAHTPWLILVSCQYEGWCSYHARWRHLGILPVKTGHPTGLVSILISLRGNFGASRLWVKCRHPTLCRRLRVAAEATLWWPGFLRHPAKIQTIVGSMNPGRLTKDCPGLWCSVCWHEKQWYHIYRSAGNILPWWKRIILFTSLFDNDYFGGLSAKAERLQIGWRKLVNGLGCHLSVWWGRWQVVHKMGWCHPQDATLSVEDNATLWQMRKAWFMIQQLVRQKPSIAKLHWMES